MAEDDLIKTLDLCDDYATSNASLASTLKQGFFSLAQIRYSTGYGKVMLSDTSSSPVLIAVNLLDEDEPAFTLQQPLRGKETTPALEAVAYRNGKSPDLASSNPSQEFGGLAAPDGKPSLPGQDSAHSGDFSSLISELAEKYGCDGRESSGGLLLEGEEGDKRVERTFMPPQLRGTQAKFKEALALAIQVANDRMQLVKHLQDSNT